MPKKIDLTGQKYGRWTVLGQGDWIGIRTAWVCACECGSVETISGNSLRVGSSKSCGCLHRERARDANFVHGNTSGWKKNQKESRAYVSWRAAKERCFNHRAVSFPNYGGRGIGMFPAWSDSFKAFLSDMGECPPLGTLDRIDSNGDYKPGNCRWATRSEQSRNTRRNVRIELNGEALVAKDFAKKAGFGYNKVLRDIRLGRLVTLDPKVAV